MIGAVASAGLLLLLLAVDWAACNRWRVAGRCRRLVDAWAPYTLCACADPDPTGTDPRWSSVCRRCGHVWDTHHCSQPKEMP